MSGGAAGRSSPMLTRLAWIGQNLPASIGRVRPDGTCARQVSERERPGRPMRLLSPGLAEILFSAAGEALLETHRRQIAVVSCRLVSFGALAESLAAEEVVSVLREYHTALGEIVHDFDATVSTLDEDRLKVVLNDPLPRDNRAGQAVALAVAIAMDSPTS